MRGEAGLDPVSSGFPEVLLQHCGDTTCNAHGPSFAQADVVAGWEYPDTNLRGCYDDSVELLTCPAFPCAADGSPAFCGQDSQYGWDTTHPDPAVRWTRTGDAEPLVTDNITGLMWQGCAAGLSGPACTTGGVYVKTWADAMTYCDGLSWGGYSDWRLPDYHELPSIVDLGTHDPSIDGTAFPATPATLFWSSSVFNGGHSDRWYVGFDRGYLYPENQIEVLYARCVRSGPSAIGSSTRFVRSEPAPIAAPEEFVTTDRKTNPMWQGCAAGQTGTLDDCTGIAASYSWQAALSYCEGLTWGGFSDWRLPNRAELVSIADPGRYNPAIDGTAFPGTPADYFWSSSSFVNGPTLAWPVRFDNGVVDFMDPKDATYFTRCLRTGS